MELITKNNITVDKLRRLFSIGVGGHSPLFHLATKKGVLTVKLSILSAGTFMIKSPPHTNCIVAMEHSRVTYLNGTYDQLVEWFKDGTYNIVVRERR